MPSEDLSEMQSLPNNVTVGEVWTTSENVISWRNKLDAVTPLAAYQPLVRLPTLNNFNAL